MVPTTADFETDAESAFKRLLTFDFDTIVKTLLVVLRAPAVVKQLAVLPAYTDWLTTYSDKLVARHSRSKP
jgi:hypothetical protein